MFQGLLRGRVVPQLEGSQRRGLESHKTFILRH